ncbi:methylmalonyl Co-A mutase-associated GTPase MeaB [soil metagenome]
MPRADASAREPGALVEAARRGDRAALARALSLIEQGGAPAREVGRLAHPHGGTAYTVGVTGAPGGGTSPLVAALVGVVRTGGQPVAVLAIDPSSPFTGGAILGDRVRMSEHTLDPEVFLHSMASRGHLGDLALATPQAVRLRDATCIPWVLLETVGVGQVEVEVAGAADTTVVVVNPGWGDAVQASKAGLLEVADVFVVNKADRPGAADTRRDLEGMLELGARPAGAWRPPVLEVVATQGRGVEDVWGAVARHREHLEATGALTDRRARRATEELRAIVARTLEERAAAVLGNDLDRLRDDVVDRSLDPYSAADRVLAALDEAPGPFLPAKSPETADFPAKNGPGAEG